MLQLLKNNNVSSNNDIYEILLKTGRYINAYDTKKKTVLHYAVKEKSKEIFDRLISEGSDINAKDGNNWKVIKEIY